MAQRIRGLACIFFILNSFLLAFGRVYPKYGVSASGVPMSIEEQMGWLASAVYQFDKYPVIAGWVQVKKLRLGATCVDSDNFALYEQKEKNKCAIAIAGTDSVADMFDNFDGRTTSGCGFPDMIHQGYMKEVNDFVKSCDFYTEWIPLLNSSRCSGGISVVGHSLGGGVASIFAACANNNGKPYGFFVNELWTFGAPASAKNPLHNEQHMPSGCFSGGRVWNEDYFFFDPIPALSRGPNFFHARVEARRLREQTDWLYRGLGKYIETSFGCGSWQSMSKPNPTDGTPWGTLHSMKVYARRVAEKFTGHMTPGKIPSPPADLNNGTAICSSSCSLLPRSTCGQIAYHYEPVSKVFSGNRTDFSGWEQTVIGILTTFLIGSFALSLSVCGVKKWDVKKRVMNMLIYNEQRYYLNIFLAECTKKFNEQKAIRQSGNTLLQDPDRDFYTTVIELVEERRADPASPLHQAGLEQIHSSGAVKTFRSQMRRRCERFLTKFCGCCKRSERRRSAVMQLFILLVLQSVYMTFVGIARSLLAVHRRSGDSMGVRWGVKNSEWMTMWTIGITFSSPSAMAALGIVLVLLGHPDWLVVVFHALGLVGAAGELQLMWLENLEASGRISRGAHICSSGFAGALLVIALVKNWRSDAISRGKSVETLKKSVVGCLLLAAVTSFVGHTILAADPGGFPSDFDAVALRNIFIFVSDLGFIVAFSLHKHTSKTFLPGWLDALLGKIIGDGSKVVPADDSKTTPADEVSLDEHPISEGERKTQSAEVDAPLPPDVSID